MLNSKKQLVFVDDSGDPGFKSGSSDNFVVAAALFMEPSIAESVMKEMDGFRRSLGWKYNHEFKFSKNPKNVILEAFRKIHKYDFSIYATYIDKSNFKEIAPEMIRFFDKEKLYNWMIKELLCGMPIENAKITIDGRSGKQHMRNAGTYLRREVNKNNSKNINIRFEDSATTTLLQVSDLIAGAINRSLQSDKTDRQRYISIIEDKVVDIRKITFR